MLVNTKEVTGWLQTFSFFFIMQASHFRDEVIPNTWGGGGGGGGGGGEKVIHFD